MADDKFLIRLGADVTGLQTDLQAANKSVSGFVSKLQGLGSLSIAGFATGAIVSSLQKMVVAGAESIDNENKLLFALKGRLSVQQSLIEQASRLHNTTLFEDDEIIKQQALLAALGRNEYEIRKVIDAAVNLSAATGIDLNQAVEALNKTYAGVGRSLAAIDPAFKSLTAAELVNGDAIELVQKKYDGFAKALTNSGGGPMKQFSKQLDDFGENLGKAVLPGVNKLLGYGNDILTVFNSDKVNGFEKYIAGMVAILPGGITMLQQYGKALKDIEETQGKIDNTQQPANPGFRSAMGQGFTLQPETIGAIKQRIKELTTELDKVTNNNQYRAIKLKIEIQEARLDDITNPLSESVKKHLAAVLKNTGAIVKIELPKIEGLPDKVASPFTPMVEKMKTDVTEFQKLAKFMNMTTLELSQSFAVMGASILTTAIEAGVSGEGFGKGILKGLAGFGKQYGAQLISMGFGKIAEGLITRNPNAIKNGGIAIAAGSALAAGSAALSKSLSSIGSGGSRDYGSDYSNSSFRSSVNGNTQNLIVQGEFRLRGRDLVAAVKSGQEDNRILGGG